MIMVQNFVKTSEFARNCMAFPVKMSRQMLTKTSEAIGTAELTGLVMMAT